MQLANYLHTTLANSRRSRKRWKKRKLGGGDPDMAFGGWVGGSMGVHGVQGGDMSLAGSQLAPQVRVGKGRLWLSCVLADWSDKCSKHPSDCHTDGRPCACPVAAMAARTAAMPRPMAAATMAVT